MAWLAQTYSSSSSHRYRLQFEANSGYPRDCNSVKKSTYPQDQEQAYSPVCQSLPDASVTAMKSANRAQVL